MKKSIARDDDNISIYEKDNDTRKNYTSPELKELGSLHEMTLVTASFGVQ